MVEKEAIVVIVMAPEAVVGEHLEQWLAPLQLVATLPYSNCWVWSIAHIVLALVIPLMVVEHQENCDSEHSNHRHREHRPVSGLSTAVVQHRVVVPLRLDWQI